MLLILMILSISNIQLSSLINTVNIEIFSVNYKNIWVNWNIEFIFRLL